MKVYNISAQTDQTPGYLAGSIKQYEPEVDFVIISKAEPKNYKKSFLRIKYI